MVEPASNFVVAATGLLFEARIAEQSKGVRAVVSGGRAEALELRLLDAINAGGRAIISFGIAGGLKPGLKPGDVIVAARVQDGVQIHESDAAWRDRLKEHVPDAVLDKVVGCEAPVATVAGKRALFDRTNAAAADMESHIAARIAQAHGLPFAALRVVADSSNRDVPAAALVGMKEDGNADIVAVLKNLAQRPTQLPALILVATDTGKAKASLLRCLRLLGPGLGFFDLG
jgi:adenosylhomocysteine nucleosidase